jgi:hypothetical protein
MSGHALRTGVSPREIGYNDTQRSARKRCPSGGTSSTGAAVSLVSPQHRRNLLARLLFHLKREEAPMLQIAAPSWLSWYHAQFCLAFATKTGNGFEDFIDRLLRAYHPDYINPTPKGTLGDGGCDGLTIDGKTFYAMFGYLPNRGENKLAAKVRSDFVRAVSQWNSFENWNFVTNVGIGPEATKVIVELQANHPPDSERPIKLSPLDSQAFWEKIASKLDLAKLDEVFPGVPHAANLELRDIVELLDALTSSTEDLRDDGHEIRPVPLEKMQFNALPPTAQYEFQIGRLHAGRITRWYEEQAEPLLRDLHGRKFRQLYQEARQPGGNVLEQLYIYLGGTDFRLDNPRANAVYAVTAFFFDECDIFETPPEEVA